MITNRKTLTEREMKWMDANKQLPEDNTLVLIRYIKQLPAKRAWRFDVGRYQHNENKAVGPYWENCHEVLIYVSHWCHIEFPNNV